MKSNIESLELPFQTGIHIPLSW